MEAISNLKVGYANRTALRISVAATLAVICAFAFTPYHKVWLWWFSGFSVIINLLMFPDQSRQHRVMWERLISILLSILLCLIVFYLFRNNRLLYASLIFIFSAFCMYQVGKHHRYHYGYFLAMIFAALTATFALFTANLLPDILQLGLAVIIALIAITVTDWFIEPHTAAMTLNKIETLTSNALTTLTIKKSVNMLHFTLSKEFIERAKDQHDDTLLKQKSYHLENYRVIAHKINFINQYVNKESALIQTKITEIYNYLNKVNRALRHRQINKLACLHLSEMLCDFGNLAKKENKISLFIIYNELQLIIEDIRQLSGQMPEANYPSLPAATKPRHKLNHQALIFCIRTMISVATAIYLIFLLRLPGNVQTVIAAIVVSSAPNIGSSAGKVFMRAGGILTGGIAGFLIALLVMHTQLLSLYIICFFLFVLGAARSSLLSEKYSYVGIQAAVFFLITLSASDGPDISGTLALNRLEGVFIGGLIGLFMVMIIQPEIPRTQLKFCLSRIKVAVEQLLTALQQPKTTYQELKTTTQEIDQYLTQASTLNKDQAFLLSAKDDSSAWLTKHYLINSIFKQLLRLCRTKTGRDIVSQIIRQDRQSEKIKDINTLDISSQSIYRKAEYCVNALNDALQKREEAL